MTSISLPNYLLNPDHWGYLAEGGKNLVLRYSGPSLDKDPFAEPSADLDDATQKEEFSSADGSTRTRTGNQDCDSIALRISKKEIHSSTSTSSDNLPSTSNPNTSSSSPSDPSEISPDEFRETVIFKLLEPATINHRTESLIPKTVRRKVSSSFLVRLSQKIESSRPEKRRLRSQIDVELDEIWLVQDLTSGNGMQSLAIEIKPKWGFLPSTSSDSPKSNTSRYKMHRILKDAKHLIQPHSKSQTSDQDSTISKITSEIFSKIYDPLDLYSGDSERVEKALKALFDEWLNGMYGSLEEKKEESNNLKIFLAGRVLDGGKEEDLKDLLDFFSNPSSPATSLSDTFVSTILPSFLPFTPSSSSPPPVLPHLSHLQASLDAFDVTGLWERINNSSSSRTDLLSEPTIKECQEITELWLSNLSNRNLEMKRGENRRPATSDVEFLESLTLRQIVLCFLLSATFKDCSLFLSVLETSGDGNAKRKYETKFHLVDLDPKPIDRLEHYLKLDQEVLEVFRRWKEDVEME